MLAFFVACFAIIGIVGNDCSWIEIAAACVCIVATMIRTRYRSFVLATFCAFVFGCGLVALLQEPYRGTHRWLHAFNFRINLAPALGLCAVMAAAAPGRVSKCGALIGLALLIVTAAYTVAFIAALSVCALFFALHPPLRVIALLSVVLALFALVVSTNQNRLIRATEFFTRGSEVYQVNRARSCVVNLRVFTGSDDTRRIPAQTTDFALLHLQRQFGWIAGLLIASFYAAIVWILCDVALYGPPSARTFALGLSTFIAFSFLFHTLVNVTAIPPTGAPVPFLGKGGTLWCASAICLGCCAGTGTRAASPDARVLTLKLFNLGLLAISCILMVISLYAQI